MIKDQKVQKIKKRIKNLLALQRRILRDKNKTLTCSEIHYESGAYEQLGSLLEEIESGEIFSD